MSLPEPEPFVWSALDNPGTGEVDALLEALETRPETAVLRIPISATLVRFLLRATYINEDGTRARMIGGTFHGDEFTPIFREIR